jgi:hypothetical protein
VPCTTCITCDMIGRGAKTVMAPLTPVKISSALLLAATLNRTGEVPVVRTVATTVPGLGL